MPYACWPFSDVSPYRILSLRTIKSSIWPRPAPIFHRIRQKSATTPRVIPSESAHLHNYFEAVSHFERQLLTRRPAGSSRANQADQWRKHGRVTATEVADPNLLLAHQIRFQRETLGGGTRVRPLRAGWHCWWRSSSFHFSSNQKWPAASVWPGVIRQFLVSSRSDY